MPLALQDVLTGAGTFMSGAPEISKAFQQQEIMKRKREEWRQQDEAYETALKELEASKKARRQVYETWQKMYPEEAGNFISPDAPAKDFLQYNAPIIDKAEKRRAAEAAAAGKTATLTTLQPYISSAKGRGSFVRSAGSTLGGLEALTTPTGMDLTKNIPPEHAPRGGATPKPFEPITELDKSLEVLDKVLMGKKQSELEGEALLAYRRSSKFAKAMREYQEKLVTGGISTPANREAMKDAIRKIMLEEKEVKETPEEKKWYSKLMDKIMSFAPTTVESKQETSEPTAQKQIKKGKGI